MSRPSKAEQETIIEEQVPIVKPDDEPRPKPAWRLEMELQEQPFTKADADALILIVMAFGRFLNIQPSTTTTPILAFSAVIPTVITSIVTNGDMKELWIGAAIFFALMIAVGATMLVAAVMSPDGQEFKSFVSATATPKLKASYSAFRGHVIGVIMTYVVGIFFGTLIIFERAAQRDRVAAAAAKCVATAH